MAELVAELGARADRPILKIPTSFKFGVLRTDSSNKAQFAGDVMAVAEINDVNINLAAGDLRKLKQLESVDRANLIVPVQKAGIPTLYGEFVAVYESIRRVVVMGVAESACNRKCGDRIDRMHSIENGRVREPWNIANPNRLAGAKKVATR